MSDDLELDLPLTGAQALAGHEFALTLSRRVLEGAQWTPKDEALRLRTPAGVAPRTVLRLSGGLAIALLGMRPWQTGAVNGAAKPVALAGAAAFLAAVCLATWGADSPAGALRLFSALLKHHSFALTGVA